MFCSCLFLIADLPLSQIIITIACSEQDQLYKTSHNTATYGKHPSSETASGNSRQNQLKSPTVRGLVDKKIQLFGTANNVRVTNQALQ